MRRGSSPTWPSAFQPHGRWRRNHMWPEAAQTSQTRSGGPHRWLTAALLLVAGAIVGAFLVVVLLVIAEPRPVPLPTQTGVGHVTVTVDDAYLTAAIRQAASSVPAASGFSRLTAHAVPGDRILLSGTSDSFLISVPVAMTMQPVVSNGHLNVHVLQATAGGIPLPAFLDAQIENAINAQVSALGRSALSGTPNYVVTSVATTYGHITLTLGSAA